MFIFSLKPKSYQNQYLAGNPTSPLTTGTYTGYNLTANAIIDNNNNIDFTNANSIQDLSGTTPKTSVLYNPGAGGFIQALSVTATNGTINLGLVTNVTPIQATKFEIVKIDENTCNIYTTIDNTEYALAHDEDTDLVYLQSGVRNPSNKKWTINFLIV